MVVHWIMQFLQKPCPFTHPNAEGKGTDKQIAHVASGGISTSLIGSGCGTGGRVVNTLPLVYLGLVFIAVVFFVAFY